MICHFGYKDEDETETEEETETEYDDSVIVEEENEEWMDEERQSGDGEVRHLFSLLIK